MLGPRVGLRSEAVVPWRRPLWRSPLAAFQGVRGGGVAIRAEHDDVPGIIEAGCFERRAASSAAVRPFGLQSYPCTRLRGWVCRRAPATGT